MKCPFYDDCELKSASAMTCVEDGGGSYCGKYRVFANMGRHGFVQVRKESK
jgi:hypothetical protein